MSSKDTLMRIHRTTLKRLRGLKVARTMSDDEALNMILDAVKKDSARK